jgi:hypothetical protein
MQEGQSHNIQHARDAGIDANSTAARKAPSWNKVRHNEHSNNQNHKISNHSWQQASNQ